MEDYDSFSLLKTELFDFFCYVSDSGTGLREELIIEFLLLKQSRFYSENACQAFSDWFIFSRLHSKPGLLARCFIPDKYHRLCDEYELARAHFYDLTKDDGFNGICCSLHDWYKSGKKRCTADLKLLGIDKSLVAESGVLKGHADAIEEGLVVDGDGVIPVPNVSSYVLSQVILFLEKKQHFQETHDKAAAHYEAWSTAFFNRNSLILPELHQAAQDLQIPSLLESIGKVQKRKEGGHLNDNLSSEMFHYFCGMAGTNKRSRAILEELNNIKLFRGLDKVACEKFGIWFTQIGDLGRDHHNEFKTLMKSPHFSQVCLSLYWGDERLQFAQVSLRSQDGKVLKIDKSVAVDESVFLRRCVRCSGWWTEIPVSIRSPVLSSVIDFCYKVWDFHKIYGSRRIKEGLVVVDHFRGWVTEFLKNNIDMLSELYEAADFLEIPSLMLLTTEDVTDLVTRPLDKASVLSGKVSFSRMLSSLFFKFT
ncbi:uncharacterized protein [Arachis hypogaea]|uniref:Uncharacterized protein n=1 Tax=Arachis hypogaea TaxID=3818 RepID=A0A445C3S8_ARAHY|nr:uncharacterized protein LOC112702060 [Arachis hypogaea]QHO26855.1 uncharacterized protein DS421_7g203060 [Arachis hypogaea]RYR45592.1 hypothetical protein Ahy_A07g031418 isoform A [Arachis hypogaea]